MMFPNRYARFERRFAVTAAVLTAAIVGGVIFIHNYTKPVRAQVTASLPFASVVSVGGSSVQIVAVNPTRRSIQICLPAVANTVTIAPAPLTPVASTLGISMVGSITASGPTCFTPPANVASQAGQQGGAGNAWNAIASATTNVTVLEW